jgi:tRNA-guanine family transglycosylase
MLGPVLVSVHNIRFYQRFMADLRRAIAGGTFDDFCRTDARCSLGPTGSEPSETGSPEGSEA